MKALSQQHRALGARLAPDQIPLDFGDQAAELRAARDSAILLDRSHEGRVLLTGRDRFALVNRMSTNDVESLALYKGAPTVFTNPNARILFRALCCHIPDGLLLITEAGQGAALASYLQRNIFYGDQARVADIGAQTAQFALHGPKARAILGRLASDLAELKLYDACTVSFAGADVTVVRRKPVADEHWALALAADKAADVQRELLALGAPLGLVPAGSLTYNSLRIRSGAPAAPELTSDFIPLEVGLWDEVSFSKGCYTGQEVLARMESRGRVAKMLVRLALPKYAPAPSPVYADEALVGTLTSSVLAADEKVYALAVVRLSFAGAGSALFVGADRLPSQVLAFAGTPPPFVIIGE